MRRAAEMPARRRSNFEPLAPARKRGASCQLMLLCRDVHLDLPGLGFGLLLQLQLEYACIVAGNHVLGVRSSRKKQGTIKGAKPPLDAVEVLFLLFFLELALALHGKRVVFDANVQVLLFDARSFELENDF